ncbi:STAS domain-containing protein [Dactylosporangium sp. McL0621]|uniref:STAS domain-containing protein n=1 Tax=Dactylosporangium sp. McL0621 TaxID=3415678 RepID=UPI003CE73ED1
MTTPLHITIGRSADGVAQLSAVGEIDLTNAPEFAARLRDALGGGSRALVDLTRVDYLDSAALATLFAHADRLDIRISPLNEALLSFSGLDQLAAVEVVAEGGSQ